MTKKKPSEKLKKRGRKSLYNPDIHPKKAHGLTLMGKTNDEVAKALGITRETLNQWKKQFPEFSDSIKGTKDIADAPVVKSLYQRALGYEYTETSVKNDPDKGIITTTTVKQVAPDVTAQIFWLKNRQPRDWRDKQTVELGGEVKFTDARELLTRKLNSLATRAAKKDAPK